MEKITIDFKDLEGKKERFCIKEIKKILNSKKLKNGKILVLYGLRRTGKTFLMQQIINNYKTDPSYKDKWAFFEIEKNDKMENIYKILMKEQKKGTKLICLDELTLAKDFVENSAILADIFAKEGLQIIVAGTDSLKFDFASEQALYNRTEKIQTTHISFAEHSKILGTKNIDDYIQYGGLMRPGIDESIVTNYNDAVEYLDGAVVENIINSIKKDKYNNKLKNISEKDLKTIIEKIVELYNGKFDKETFTKKLENVSINGVFQFFKNIKYSDFIKTISVYNTNIVKEFSKFLKIDNKINIKISEDMVLALKDYLLDMDLLSIIKKTKFIYNKNDENSNNILDWDYYNLEDEYYIIQPAIKYNHLKKGIEFINTAVFFSKFPELKGKIIKALDDNIKGYMLEQIVSFDVSKSLNHNKYSIFKPVFVIKENQKNQKKIEKIVGEYDLFICNKKENNYYAFEIKHADKIIFKQDKTLTDKDITEYMNTRFGNKVISAVLYQGKSCFKSNGTIFLNIADFLIAVDKYKDMDLVVNNLTKNLDYFIPKFDSKLKSFDYTTLPKNDKYQYYFAVCKELIEKNPFEFLYVNSQYLPKETKAQSYIQLCKIAISKKPILLKNINLDLLNNNYDEYMALCEIAVNQVPLTIKDININYFSDNKKYIKLWKIAIETDPYLLKYFNNVNSNDYMNLYEIAINKSVFLIKYINNDFFIDKNRYIKLWNNAINKNPQTIKFLNPNTVNNDEYENLFIQAFKVDKSTLKYIDFKKMSNKYKDITQLEEEFESIKEFDTDSDYEI